MVSAVLVDVTPEPVEPVPAGTAGDGGDTVNICHLRFGRL